MHNKTKFLLLVVALSVLGVAQASPKYLQGDCITPTAETYSWYGKYARVEAFSKIEGYSGENYILAFPKSVSNSVIFGQEIESQTKRVDRNLCSPY